MDLSEQQKPLLKQTISRRSKAAIKAMREQMQALETEGKSRADIARLTGATPAQVTRLLGARRRYGWRRM